LRGASTLARGNVCTLYTTSAPASAPMTMALTGATLAQQAVIATSPPRTPFSDMLISGLPAVHQVVSVAESAPAQAARLVLTAIRPTALPTPPKGASPPPVTPVVLPALKPN